jgi:hypothetical protein
MRGEKVFEQLKTNPMNRNLRAFERDVDCGIGYIGVAFVPSSGRGERKIIPSKL